MSKIDRYERGEQILITQGEYSDYSVYGLFNVCRDFVVQDVVAEWLASEGIELDQYNTDLDKLLGFLNSKGYVADAPHRELYLGAYSTLASNLLPDGKTINKYRPNNSGGLFTSESETFAEKL